MSLAGRTHNQIGFKAGTKEHVTPNNAPPASRLPVMANLYTSNEHFYAKRANPTPVPVTYSTEMTGRVNKFTADHNIVRPICDTYTATDRNHTKNPTVSPYMMENGVANKEVQRDRDYNYS